MKQTAVEWLIERLMDGQVDNKMLAQAKEMEREQQSYSEEDMRKAIQETITLMRYKATEFREHENTVIKKFKKK